MTRYHYYSRIALTALVVVMRGGPASAYQAPFLTTADMQIHLTDARGIIESDGRPVRFYYLGIRAVQVGRRALPVLQQGHDLLPPGRQSSFLLLSVLGGVACPGDWSWGKRSERR